MSSVDWAREYWEDQDDGPGKHLGGQVGPASDPLSQGEQDGTTELPDEVKAKLREWKARIFEAIDDEEVGGRGVARE